MSCINKKGEIEEYDKRKFTRNVKMPNKNFAR